MLRVSTLAAAMTLVLSLQAHAQSAQAPTAQGQDRPQASHTDTGVIQGVVSNAGRGGFIVGAEVRVAGHEVVAVTDSDGRFTLSRVPQGRHELSVSYIGRPDQRQTVEVVPGQVASVQIAFGGTEGTGDATTLDGVVVSAMPIAESEWAALQLQRSSTSLVSVVAADSIGRFPDQNVAAALSRLPGIAVERDQGQERYVSLRGAPSRWTTIAFDGVNIISPAGRTARLDTIPAAIASKVVVNKAITAAMPSETLAGNIDIITRSPFDYEGFKVAGDAGIGYNDLGGGKQYNYGGFISNKFADDRFGVLLSASHYTRDMVTDNFETDYEIAAEDQEPGSSERVWADATQNKLYRLTRENDSVSGRLEFRPSDDHRFFLSSIYTQFTDDELRNAHEFDFDTGAVPTSDTRDQAVAQRNGYADIRTGNTPERGVVFGTELDSTLNIGANKQSIFTTTLGGDQRFDDWRTSWRLNYTRAEEESGPSFNSTWRSPSERTLRPTVEYDYTDPHNNAVRLYETIRNPDGSFSRGNLKRSLDPSDYQFVSLRSNRGLAKTDGSSARLDLSRDTELFGQPTELSFGAQYDHRAKENNQSAIEILPNDLVARGIAIPTTDDFATNTPYKGDFPLGYSFRYFDENRAWSLLNGLLGQGVGNDVPEVAEANYYEVTESIAALYGMATTHYDWGNIVAGVRGEYTRNSSQALTDKGNGYEPIKVSDSGVEFFPSLHVNWDLNEEMKLRFSANTGSSRPDYTDLRPNYSINDDDQEIDGGNPFAQPEKSVGVDAYFEWYMRPQGFFSAGLYYKDLRDVLFDVEIPAFGSDILDTPALDRSTYTYYTVGNGGDGYIRGIELAYSQKLGGLADSLGLPAWVGDFGVQANLTLNDSKATTPDGREIELPGASDVIYNTSVYYEAHGLSARLSWQYRSEWIDSIGSGDAMGDAYWDEVGRLDFSVRYAINDNVEVYLDGNNLLDEPGIRYQGIPARSTEYEAFGARYMIGMRFNL